MVAETSSSADIDIAPPGALLELLSSQTGEEVVKTTVVLVFGPVTGEVRPLQCLRCLVVHGVGGVRGEERVDLPLR